MKPRHLVIALGFMGACRPDVGEAPSLVSGPKILAVRGQPAEVKPGQMVRFDVLAAAVDGTIDAQAASWRLCITPKPPAEANAVSRACVDDTEVDAMGAALDTMIPTSGCTLFGPITPPPMPGEPPLRPRDPDGTGGYYIPMRVTVPDDSTGGSLMAFALQRMACNLANAPSDVTGAFNTRYQANQNPHLAEVTLTLPGQGPVTLVAGQPAQVGSKQLVRFEASFTPESPETFPVYDLTQLALVDHRESLRVSWFATAGSFEHDRTGRAESDPLLTTDNGWLAPTVGESTVVHVWVVLRDSRGGTDFTSFDLEVVP